MKKDLTPQEVGSMLADAHALAAAARATPEAEAALLVERIRSGMSLTNEDVQRIGGVARAEALSPKQRKLRQSPDGLRWEWEAEQPGSFGRTKPAAPAEVARYVAKYIEDAKAHRRHITQKGLFEAAAAPEGLPSARRGQLLAQYRVQAPTQHGKGRLRTESADDEAVPDKKKLN